MRLVRNIKDIRSQVSFLKKKGETIGLVPTMGALHDGHISLISEARKENDFVVVSIFVNPLQFGPKEDFKKYPRNIMRDVFICDNEGVDLIFYPRYEQMYPKAYKTYVYVEDLSNVLCGNSRPGHFRGVATVVSKLFNIVQPDIAYFGQKDAQQAIIIKRMVEDLNIPVRVKIMPTIRDENGLALSSRNEYLSQEEKEDALVLSQALKMARILISNGECNSKKIIHIMRQMIRQKNRVKIDYISIVDLKNLEPVKIIKGKVLIALAVWVGETRLIDNLIINGKKKN